MDGNTPPKMALRVAVQLLGHELSSLGQDEREIAAIFLMALARQPDRAADIADRLARLVEYAGARRTQHEEKPVAGPARLTGHSAAPARRRLAPNVLCLFADDRPPVIDKRRRKHQPASQ